MDNDNQAAIDLYAPIALQYTRDQYSKAKINLEQQHLQLADLQEHLINQQAEKIETQQLLIREMEATIAELRDELGRVRSVLTSIADVTTPMLSRVPKEIHPRAEYRGEYGDGGGGDMVQQNVSTRVSSRPTTMLRVDKELPAMPPIMKNHPIADSLDLKPREQSPPRLAIGDRPLSSPTNGLYGSNSPNAYTSPRVLSTMSLPFQMPEPPNQSHHKPASPTISVHHDTVTPKSRHQRYASPLGIVREISPPPTPEILSARQGNLPPMGHMKKLSREGLRGSVLSPSLSIQKNEPLAVKTISLDRVEAARGARETNYNEDEEAMRKSIRSEAEKRKKAAFSPRDNIERDSRILTYITTTTTTQEDPKANRSSTKLNRLTATSERLGKKISDSKKKKPGIQKSSITHPSLNLPSEMPREVRSKFTELSETETTNDVNFERITGLIDLQTPANGLPLNGDMSGGNRRYRDGKTGKVMDKIRGWKEKEKDKVFIGLL